MVGLIFIQKKKIVFFGENHETKIEIFDYETEKEKYKTAFKNFVKTIDSKEKLNSYELGIWIMLLEAANNNGIVDDEAIKTWAKDHAKEVETYADYLEDYSKRKLKQQGLLTFDTVTVWGGKSEVDITSEKGEQLFDRLIQFQNHLGDIYIGDYADDSNKLTFTEVLIWASIFGENDKITKQFEQLVPDSQEEYPVSIYSYWYWHGIYDFRSNYTAGLTSGGFSSGTSGLGGSTSAGGGAGAGGGGGGGAR